MGHAPCRFSHGYLCICIAATFVVACGTRQQGPPKGISLVAGQKVQMAGWQFRIPKGSKVKAEKIGLFENVDRLSLRPIGETKWKYHVVGPENKPVRLQLHVSLPPGVVGLVGVFERTDDSILGSDQSAYSWMEQPYAILDEKEEVVFHYSPPEKPK